MAFLLALVACEVELFSFSVYRTQYFIVRVCTLLAGDGWIGPVISVTDTLCFLLEKGAFPAAFVEETLEVYGTAGLNSHDIFPSLYLLQ